jgi:hypothetical protein
MHQELFLLAAVIAGALGIAGLIPYFRDIFRHKTKPERTMWWIYTFLFTLLFFAQKSAGAHWLLIVSAGYVLSSALIVLMVIVMDFAGFWLALVKTWHAPHSETLISWQLSLIGAVLSVFSAGTWKFTIIIYPLYAVLGTALLVWLIMYRRLKIKEDPSDF